MSVFKRYRGKRITSKDKNWSKGTWYVWKRINGKVVHKALKDAVTKEQAEAAARKIIERAFNQRYGIADTTTEFKEFADSVYTDYVKQTNVNITTKLQYIKLLNEHFKNQVLTTITPHDCRQCQSRMIRKGYAAGSVNRIMSTLSKLLTIAGQEGIIDSNPMRFVKKLEEPEPRSRLLTAKEWENLLKWLETDDLICDLITLAVNLPLRRGQLLAITPDAIDLSNGWLWALASKGRRRRAIPLNNTAANTLRSMLEKGTLPFPLKDFRKRWKRLTVSAGINKKDGKRGENYTFHDLRHELASNLIRNNVNPEIVKRLFAHSDMSITQVYINPDMAQMAEAIKTLDKVKNETSTTEMQPTEDWPDEVE